MSELERIKKVVNYLIYMEFASNETDLANKLGYKKSSFSQIMNGKVPVSDKFIDNLLKSNLNINKVWIKTGKGSMFLDQQEDKKPEILLPNKIIPLYDIEAVAGLYNTPVSIMEDDIMAKYIVPDFTMAEFMVRVKGSSMYPKYNSGDIIACKMIKDISLIQWGKVYLIHHFEQGAMVKRLFSSEKEAHFSCHSDNTKYPPFDVKINDLTNIALVVGVIRLE
ncbi:MAG: helix-turn-helix transcriptional regulator [Flavobacteriia bacterium]|nr:helix-turn-helix transcriptional regulator [Flavobacteriia bacterium]